MWGQSPSEYQVLSTASLLCGSDLLAASLLCGSDLFFEISSHYVTQAGLELMALLQPGIQMCAMTLAEETPFKQQQ